MNIHLGATESHLQRGVETFWCIILGLLWLSCNLPVNSTARLLKPIFITKLLLFSSDERNRCALFELLLDVPVFDAKLPV